MKMQVRIALLTLIVALGAAVALLRQSNASLEARVASSASATTTGAGAVPASGSAP